ncbi:hypothetical protein B0O99DRAFT_747376 [Bisporella sp. PMI_857]|nr:hypothetical protein B0O99DRAFT_747376 [Bisporella sp. PMI_857]
MQLFTITIAALGFGSQVLTAPTAQGRQTISEIEYEAVGCVNTGDLTCITKRDIPIVPTVGTVEPTVNSLPVVGSLVGSVTDEEGAAVDTVETTVSSVPAAGPIVGNNVGTVTSVSGSIIKKELPVVGSLVDPVLSTAEGAAAPDVGPLVNGVSSTITSTVGPALDTVEDTAESIPVAGPVLDTVLKRASPPSSITKRSPVSVLSGAVSTLKWTIGWELLSMTNAVQSLADIPAPAPGAEPVVVDSIAPTLQTSLGKIATVMNKTITTITPSVSEVAEPLSLGEIGSLLNALTGIKSVLGDLEDNILTTVNTVSEETKKTIKNDVALVLSIAMPLVAPVSDYAYTVVGEVADSSGEINEVHAAAKGLFSSVGSLLSPVGILGSL